MPCGFTGELDRDLNVRPVDHIQEKLKASQSLFEQLRQEGRASFFVLSPVEAGLVPRR